jgi:hypothetical protein
MSSPVIGKEDSVEFLTMSIYLSFIHFCLATSSEKKDA